MDVEKKQSVKIIPNWLFKRYVYIWIKFKEQSFTSLDVKKEFKKTSYTSLKELTKQGWLICDNTQNPTIFRATPLQDIMESIYIDSFIFA